MALNSISLKAGTTTYTVYDPPSREPGLSRVNWFKQQTGASNYGKGEILMLELDYTAAVAGSNAAYGAAVLNMSSNQGDDITKDVEIVGASPYSTGPNEDQNLVCVQLVDFRFNYTDTVSDGYNVQEQGFPFTSAPAPVYYPSTLNSGSAWTWAQVINDIDSSLSLPVAVAWKPRNLIFDSVPICKAVDSIAAKLFLVVGLSDDQLNLNTPGVMSGNNEIAFDNALNGLGSDPPALIDGDDSSRNPARLPSSYDVIFPAFNADSTDPFVKRQYIKSINTGAGNADPQFSMPLAAPGYIALWQGGAWVDSGTNDAVASAIAAAAFTFQSQPFACYEFAGIWDFELDGAIREVEWYQDAQCRMRTRITQGNRVDYCPTDRPNAMEFVSNQLVEGLGGTQTGLDNAGVRYVFGGGPVEIWGQITGNTKDSSNFRWTYAFAQVTKTAAGFGGWSVLSGGITGNCYNTIEDINGASGLFGNGVNSANLLGTYELQPITTGDVVRLTQVDAGGTLEWQFEGWNSVDGQCT